MATHVTVRIGNPSREPEHKARDHDDDRELPGWAKHREPKDEPPAKSLTHGAGHDRWATRAAQNSYGSAGAKSVDELVATAKRRRII